MGNFLDGIQYPIMAGFCGILGALLCIPMALIGIAFPALLGWLWLPPVGGMVVGLIIASQIK